jgi:hypothetical protein
MWWRWQQNCTWRCHLGCNWGGNMAGNTRIVRACRKLYTSRHTWTRTPDFGTSWPRRNFVSPRLGIWRGYCRLSKTSPCDPNGGGLFRRPKLTLSSSAEGREGRNGLVNRFPRQRLRKQQYKNCRERFFLFGPCKVIIKQISVNKQKSYKVIKTQMFATLDKAVVKHTTVQVTRLLL